MRSLELFSEPCAPTGNMAGEGFKRLLGRPTLGLLQTVLREALQNVIDAALSENGPEVRVRVRTLTNEERAVLLERVFAQRPNSHLSAERLSASLAKTDLRILEIADFGTIGLSGPTRADIIHEGSEAPNFVNFFRNVGAGRDSAQGGGTYGYGKSSFYEISECSTVIAETLTRLRGDEVRRLIACHLGDAFDVSEQQTRRRYTGRHWWGISSTDVHVEPISGDDASRLASKLGMPERAPGQTGTTIWVIDPELPENATDDDIGREIVECILWNFWPRLTNDCAAHRRLAISVVVQGKKWEIPGPEKFPPLDLFANALSELRRKAADVIQIECERPQMTLGNLSIVRGLAAKRNPITERADSLIPRQSCHIALLRPVELVVKYLKGTPYTDPRVEWAGVFVCSESQEVESAFAQSEPPAHDDWVPDNLPKGPAKTYVNVALKRLKEEATRYADPARPRSGSSDSQDGLVGAATLLGGLLLGSGAAPRSTNAAGGGNGAVPQQTVVERPVFDKLMVGKSGERLARFRCTVRNAGNDPDLTVCATGFVCVEGGGDLAAWDNYQPEVHGLSLLDGNEVSKDGFLRLGISSGVILVDVLVPEHAAVGVKLDLIKGGR